MTTNVTPHLLRYILLPLQLLLLLLAFPPATGGLQELLWWCGLGSLLPRLSSLLAPDPEEEPVGEEPAVEFKIWLGLQQIWACSWGYFFWTSPLLFCLSLFSCLTSLADWQAGPFGPGLPALLPFLMLLAVPVEEFIQSELLPLQPIQVATWQFSSLLVVGLEGQTYSWRVTNWKERREREEEEDGY